MISAILPCYNEESCIIEFANRIETVLKSIGRHELIFMVGGTDHTYAKLVEWSRAHENIWIIYEKERGLGTAIKNAKAYLHWATDIILTMDTDLQNLPEEIPKLLEKYQHAHIVVGEHQTGSAIDARTGRKKLISSIVTRILRFIYDIRIHDLTSNFRLYDIQVVREIFPKLQSANFEMQAEVLIRANRAGFVLAETPINFKARESGKSKLNWHTMVGYAKLIWRLGF